METLKQVAGIVIAGRIAPYLSGVLPKDFPKRVHRWRRGVKPDGDGYHALVKLAALIPGGLDILMGDGFQMYLWQDWEDRHDRHDQDDRQD